MTARQPCAHCGDDSPRVLFNVTEGLWLCPESEAGACADRRAEITEEKR